MAHDRNQILASLLADVSGDLMKEISGIFSSNDRLTDRSLLALYSVYGNVCERAVELLEKDCVTFLSDPDGIRTVIQVTGSGGSLYTLLPEVNYCPCPAFRYHVVGTRTDMSCKHVLAAHLASIMNKGSKRLINSSEVSELLVKSYTNVPTLENS
ncbi:hypothetical protein R5R35_002157 [Gryllus longicercus]|uniref:SWIM-type domain-containing protein n=1 Tax=Gryllus longicercus TaxID=2509291 RepID=A0AAN9YZC0_9ORTH